MLIKKIPLVGRFSWIYLTIEAIALAWLCKTILQWTYLSCPSCTANLPSLIPLHLLYSSNDQEFPLRQHTVLAPSSSQITKFIAPNIMWLDPNKLVAHEYTSKEHLDKLIQYLTTASNETLVPIPVVTSSKPRVILDGHHRVAASKYFSLERIPVWVIDIGDEDVAEVLSANRPVLVNEMNFSMDDPDSVKRKRPDHTLPLLEKLERERRITFVKCYAREDGRQIPIADVAQAARTGNIGYGVKGTKHMADLGEGREVVLEDVVPRLEWGFWLERRTIK